MRKTLLALFISGSIYAQKCDKESYFSVSAGVDVRNAVLGSKPTNDKPELDLLIGLHAVGNNLEMNPEVEIFDKIGYWSAGANFGYHINKWYIPVRSERLNLTLVPLVGLKMINRYNQEERQLKNGDWVYARSSHYAGQVGLSLRLNLSDKFILDLTSYFSTRPDLNSRWPESHKIGVLSNYIKLHYILN